MLPFLFSYFFLLAILYSFFSVQLVPISMYIVLLGLKRIVNTISPHSLALSWYPSDCLFCPLFLFFLFCSHGDMTWGILVLCLAHQLSKTSDFILFFTWSQTTFLATASLGEMLNLSQKAVGSIIHPFFGIMRWWTWLISNFQNELLTIDRFAKFSSSLFCLVNSLVSLFLWTWRSWFLNTLFLETPI